MSPVGKSMYLTLAAAVVDTALREWLDADGYIVDPFETSDRWQGGTAARFACPAATLARHGGREDLVEPVCRVLDQLCGNLAQAMAEGRPAFVPGMMDLVCKEIMVAREQIDPFANDLQRARWDEALASVNRRIAYTMQRRRRSHGRFTNYEAYASVGEWLRCRAGLAGRRGWIDAATEGNMEWTTDRGLYRDPNAPCTYDLSVRQNWCELLDYGYDGKWRSRSAATSNRSATSRTASTR